MRRVGYALLALLYGALALGLGWLVIRSAGVWQAWQTYSAQAGVAVHVMEDSVNADDPTLGWRHVPGRSVPMPNLGPDVVWTINSQGIRGLRDYDLHVPTGLRRVVALGDSFTFGNVAFADTWPSQLESTLPGTEVLNMGASAYGVDQMYLWYRQDGVRFDTDDVVLALIDDDMRRASLDRWSSGHGRPLFQLIDGALTLTHVPVAPRLPPGAPLTGGVGFLRFYATWVVQGGWSQPPPEVDVPLAIVGALADLVHERGDRLLVVMLPERGSSGAGWTPRLAELGAQRGFEVRDLTAGFLAREAPGATTLTDEWYLRDGHYNPKGNQVVAALIAEALQADTPPAP